MVGSRKKLIKIGERKKLLEAVLDEPGLLESSEQKMKIFKLEPRARA